MATVMYVDDEVIIGRAVARWFERRGHAVHLASSIGAAQLVLAELDPDAIVIDVWLGDESGFELLSWIEDQRPHLGTRVTFVTGELVDADNSSRIWRTLGRPVLQKPFELAKLEALVLPAELRADPAENRAGT